MASESEESVPEPAEEALEPAVMAVLPEEEGSAGLVGLSKEQLATMVAGLQAEFAGAAKTGQPAVDAALERLADLDPQDLAGSADVLTDVLNRLETALGDSDES